MTTLGSGFARSSYSLLGSLIRTPGEVVSELPHLDTSFCFRFAWFCFFFSTVSTALVQMFFLDAFEGFVTDPLNYAQMSNVWGTAFGASLEEFKSQLAHLRAVSVVNLALAPLSAWFFPYLFAGALFVLMQMLSITKSVPGAYDNLVKLVCVSFGLFVFCAVPVVGPALGNIWWFFFVVRSTHSIFPISTFGRISATLLSSMVLFYVWNATVARLATTLL